MIACSVVTLSILLSYGRDTEWEAEYAESCQPERTRRRDRRRIISLGRRLPDASSNLPGTLAAFYGSQWRGQRLVPAWSCTEWGLPCHPCYQVVRWALTPPFHPCLSP